MKILMYTTNTLFSGKMTGGIKRFKELLNTLNTQGYDVMLASSDNIEDINMNNIKRFTRIERPNKFSKSPLIPNEMLFFLDNFKKLLKLKRKKFNKVIVFDVPTAISLALLNFSNIDLFIRQDLITYKQIGLKSKLKYDFLCKIYLSCLSFMELICCLKAHQIIVQCEYDKKQLLTRHKLFHNFLKNKIYVQINNINPSWNKEISHSFYDNYNLSDQLSENFKIGFIGDFDSERKGHPFLLEAVNSLYLEGKSIELYVVGDGKHLLDYKQKYLDNENIYFLGKINSPFESLIDINLFIVPSIADSCPNTMLEALYYKIPVIGTRNGGIPEILNDETALFSYEVNDIKRIIIEYMVPDNLERLSKTQEFRRKELIFNWSEKILRLIKLQ